MLRRGTWRALLALTVFVSASLPCLAAQTGGQNSRPADDARSLLRSMLTALQTLSISGEQITTVYRMGTPVTSSQSVQRIGNKALRMNYHSPPGLAGQIYVDNGQSSWMYRPQEKTLEVGPSRAGRLLQGVGFVKNLLKRGNLSAQVTGQDTIAGRPVWVVQVSAGAQVGSRRFWIDPANGAQLKIETYDDAGQLQSTSFFTSVTYGVTQALAQFTAPAVPPGVQTVAAPPPPQNLDHFPSAQEAGFALLNPTYLPDGFHFQSATVTTLRVGGRLLQLKYSNGLTLLSLFETQQTGPRGPASAGPQVRYPRPGVVTTRINDLRVVVIGNVANVELLKVALSLR